MAWHGMATTGSRLHLRPAPLSFSSPLDSAVASRPSGGSRRWPVEAPHAVEAAGRAAGSQAYLTPARRAEGPARTPRPHRANQVPRAVSRRPLGAMVRSRRQRRGRGADILADRRRRGFFSNLRGDGLSRPVSRSSGPQRRALEAATYHERGHIECETPTYQQGRRGQ